MKDKLNYYSHQKISDNLYIMTEGYSVVHRFTIGIVVGTEKVLVIDAGMGMAGDFREYVESIVGTDKPIMIATTHAHLDHAGSLMQFDEAYCSFLDEKSFDVFTFHTESRKSDLIDFSCESQETIDYCNAHMLDNTGSQAKLKDLKAGQIFDLGGGVVIETIALPGHAKGHMAFYNAKEKYAFTGDGINTDTHLKRMTCEDFEEYKKVLQNFIDKVDEDVKLYPAHLPLTMDISIAKNLIQCADDIIHHRTHGDPPGETIFHPRINNPDVRMHFVNNTAIVYSNSATGNVTDPDYINFYSCEKVSDRIYIVTENYSMVHRFTIGVIVGDDRIAVIDSGLGMSGDLRKYLESQFGTEKPLIAYGTHSNIDHIGGASQFDYRYVNERDSSPAELKRSLDTARRLRDLDAFSLHNNEVMEYCKKHMVVDNMTTFENVDEGDVIDLGGVIMTPIAVPGHTIGSLAYYIASEKVCFTGDAINADTHIKGLDRKGLYMYSLVLDRFKSKVDPDTKLYAGHLNRAQSMQTVDNIIAACNDVVMGRNRADQDPPCQSIFSDQKEKVTVRYHYNGNSCVIYDETLLNRR